MNPFDSAGLITEDKKYGPSKYISYGIQDLKINNLEVKVASTGSKQIILSVEGKPVSDPLFEGLDGAQGPVGKIKTMYVKEEQEGDITKIFAKIADSIGVRDKLDAITGVTSLEDYVSKALKVLSGKFASYVVATEQYIGTDGKAKNSFRFPKYDWVEKSGTEPSSLKFDKANKYHFKEATIPDNIGTSKSATAVKQPDSDLPF